MPRIQARRHPTGRPPASLFAASPRSETASAPDGQRTSATLRSSMPHQVRGVCPHDCPDSCAWIVTVDDDGRAVRMAGDPDHPFTRGFLCTKVARYVERTYHPDRLLFPQIRVGAKGEGKFRRATWDEALALIAEKLHGLIESHGPQAILPYSY